MLMQVLLRLFSGAASWEAVIGRKANDSFPVSRKYLEGEHATPGYNAADAGPIELNLVVSPASDPQERRFHPRCALSRHFDLDQC
jgi:hypothetical protein